MDNYREDHKAAMDDLLLPLPGVKGGKSWGYPSYKVNGKIFAFVGGNGIAIKLPLLRVKGLADEGGAYKIFEVTDGVFWKEWLSIDRAVSADYEQDLELLEESHQYVASK